MGCNYTLVRRYFAFSHVLVYVLTVLTVQGMQLVQQESIKYS